MLAARMYGKGDLRIENVNIPEINENEVLVRVKCAAICGTDVRILGNGSPYATENNPRILGHELSGIIEKVGSNIKGYKEGMRVAVAPNMGCGICSFCISGNGQLCKDYRALGINIDGGFAEFVKIPEEAVRQGNITILSDSVSFEEAAINEAFSCAYNGFSRCALQPGETCLVIGAGAIGIMHAKLAKMHGASKVIINDLSQERLDVCKEIDESFMVYCGSDGLKEFIEKETGGNGVDVTIVACPAPQAQIMALELAAVNGRINFFGGLPTDKQNVPINSNLVHYKQLIITGTTRASLTQYRKTLDFIAAGVIDVKRLVTGKFKLEDIKAGFEFSSATKGLKNVVYFE